MLGTTREGPADVVEGEPAWVRRPVEPSHRADDRWRESRRAGRATVRSTTGSADRGSPNLPFSDRGWRVWGNSAWPDEGRATCGAVASRRSSGRHSGRAIYGSVRMTSDGWIRMTSHKDELARRDHSRRAGVVGRAGSVAVPVAVTVTGRLGLFLFRLVDDQGLGRQQHAGDRAGVDQRGTGDLDRVEDALGDQVAVLAGVGVEAVADTELADLGGDDVAVFAAVLGDPAQRLVGGLAHDAYADRLVTIEAEVVRQHRHGVDQGRPTTGHDALLDRGARRGDGVLDAVLLLLELHLGGGADLDDAHAAGQLGQPLLQLLAVPVGVGVLDLGLDLADPALDCGGVTGAVDDGRVVLGDDDATRLAEHLEADLVELEADLGSHDLTAGQGRDV